MLLELWIWNGASNQIHVSQIHEIETIIKPRLRESAAQNTNQAHFGGSFFFFFALHNGFKCCCPLVEGPIRDTLVDDFHDGVLSKYSPVQDGVTLCLSRRWAVM